MVEQVLVNSSSLTSIGDAIRAKKGLSAESTFTPSEMSEQINSMTVIPEDALTITGDCTALFKNGKFSFMINTPGVKTKDITRASNMFAYCTDIAEISFDLNFTGSSPSLDTMFSHCEKLKKLPKINGLNIGTTVFDFCANCYKLEDVSSLASVNLEPLHNAQSVQFSDMFSDTYRLKEIPYSFLSNLYNSDKGFGYTIYSESVFSYCGVYALKGLPVPPYEYTKNKFTRPDCFIKMPRLKSFTFDMNGTAPKVVE